MILAALYVLMTVIAIFQNKWERSYSIMVIVLSNVSFYVVMSDTNSAWYFITAAMVDLLAIILMLPVSSKDRLSMWLSVVCGSSILLNAAGFVSWYNFREPTLYNYAYIALMVWAIILMITTKAPDVGNNRDYRLLSSFLFNRNSSRHDADGDKKKI